jgi:hypothetical protein
MDTENTPQVASSLDIAARNSMALPIIMRDINVMKQGILKLVKIAGGTQRDKADRFFLTASDREKSYETQLAAKKSTSPTKVGEKKEGRGFFGQANDFLKGIIAGGLTNALIKGGLIVGILYGIGKFFTSAEFRASASDMIGNFGKAVFGEEAWKDVKTNIAIGAGLLLTGIIAVKAALIYLSQSIAAAAWGMGGGLGLPGKNKKRPSAPRGSGLKSLSLLAAGSVLGYNMTNDSSPTESQNSTGGQGMNGFQGAAAGLAGAYGLNKVGNYVGSKVPTGGNTTSFNEKAGRFVEKTPKGGTGFKSAKDMKLADTLEKLRKLYIKLASKPGGVSQLMAKLLARFGISAFLKISVFLTSIAAAPKTAGLSLVITAISYGLWASLIYEVYQFLVGEESESSEKATKPGTAAATPSLMSLFGDMLTQPGTQSGGINLGVDRPNYYGNAGVSPSQVPSSTPGSSSVPTLQQIGQAESGKMGYDAANNGRAGDMPNGMPGLSSKKVGEVMKLQSDKPRRLFAAGKYQIIPTTLAGLVNRGVVSVDDIFNEKTQDKLGQALYDKRIANAGNDPIRQQYELSKEFAAVANPYTGISYYAGKGNNKASLGMIQTNNGFQIHQSSNALSNSRNAPAGSSVTNVDASTKVVGGGSNSVSLPSSGVIDMEFAKLLVERAIG